MTYCRRAALEASASDFDVPTDGLTEQWAEGVAFKSSTTGDSDGLDLWLDGAGGGQLLFDSASGSCEVDLGSLQGARSRQVFSLGGLEMRVCVERYPEELADLSLGLDCRIQPPGDGLTPYLVKAVQSDGHMAWSRPVYVRRREG